MTIPRPDLPFVAIDFETADHGRDSACAVALVRVEDGRIVARAKRLIRPPRRGFVFTHIHGISWRDVQHEPPFAGVWPTLTYLLEDASTLVAHNASFDRGVLRRCCEASGLPMPPQPFECTVRLARRTWPSLYSARLNVVCEHLHIPLVHHDAQSDAEACARIMIEVQKASGR
ncbi:MAG: 3'-5' exonuclease [Polyangia bacterium]|jgi:DNA polymerase-3 subunit epsilon|nr:3'-5' exonuclease [Polyangia bacterium]